MTFSLAKRLASFRSKGRRGHRSPPWRRFGPPQVEALEARDLPSILFGSTIGKSIQDNHGPILTSAHVDLIFWGSGWNSGGGPSPPFRFAERRGQHHVRALPEQPVAVP
jgi:hypothetical protein